MSDPKDTPSPTEETEIFESVEGGKERREVLSGCPDPRTLQSHLLGKVTGPAAVAIDTHFSTCAKCLAAAHKLDLSDELTEQFGALESLQPQSSDCDHIIAGVLAHPQVASKIEPELRHTQLHPSSASFSSDPVADAPLPRFIDRYRVDSVLGKGGFGIVYLARDEKLDRMVTIKLPHPHLVKKPEFAHLYISEARAVAVLDHPSIVPVFDVGCTDEYPCFIVSKHIKAVDLSKKLASHKPDWIEAALLIASIGDALQHAHQSGLVHRDVKPSNILVDEEGKPHLVDFGLALRDNHVGNAPRYCGTPAYMSPEQARGEGHRLDGRSDIFSLGVVLYELLVGRAPFRGTSTQEVMAQVKHAEPRPLRQYDEQLPRELERICFKALAKRSAERFQTAADFAKELRQFCSDTLNAKSLSDSSPTAWRAHSKISERRGYVDSSQCGAHSSDISIAHIVPKGLRSFDSQDADFFLELLAGPRDRHGLPDSIRFWKSRIEAKEAEQTFSVGLIYGPSGCGKSSLVKAGLLPRIDPSIQTAYVEATPSDTERRLLQSVRRACPALNRQLTLGKAIAALRKGHGLDDDCKLLLVIDQFEQWLHANKGDEEAELAGALRQCDGSRVQCILMVRDDFWLAVSRFMRQLEIRVAEGENSALADLCDTQHARKVLCAFGQAFGKLPTHSRDLSQTQAAFLDEAVRSLAEDGRVIYVRLALFAEMMKSREWSLATLAKVGGAKGLGETFLEETFCTSTSPPEHRYHESAARAVLGALLPSSGTDIKGQMRTYQECLASSGYTNRPEDFEELLDVLDRQLRLITPTDSHDSDTNGLAKRSDLLDLKSTGFQLTHDFLVPSLRAWLTRKKAETRTGRAELRLAELAAVWNAKRESRSLPSLLEHLRIRLWTDKKHWNAPQSELMRASNAFYGVRCAALGILLSFAVLLLFVAGNYLTRQQKSLEASRMVQGLLQAETSQIPRAVAPMANYREWVQPLLEEVYDIAAPDSSRKLHAAIYLANLPEHANNEEIESYLKQQLFSAPASQFQTICNALPPQKQLLKEEVAALARSESASPARRFRAAGALAQFDPDNTAWRDSEFTEFVTAELLSVMPSELRLWREVFRPVKMDLVVPLARYFREPATGEQAHAFATETLIDYEAEDPEALFGLFADSLEWQVSLVYPKLLTFKDRVLELSKRELIRPSPSDLRWDEQAALARRKAHAATFIFTHGDASAVWPLLKYSDDPSLRSCLVNWLGQLGAEPLKLLEQYEVENDPSVRCALMMCIGEFELSAEQRKKLMPVLIEVYRNDANAGIHAAAAWLLTHWGHGEALKEIDREFCQDYQQLSRSQPNKQWFVNGLGDTFSVIDAGQYTKGSPSAFEFHDYDEQQQIKRINRRLAFCTKEVSKRQWRRFHKQYPQVLSVNDPLPDGYVKHEDSPMMSLTWNEAAWYCNWMSQQDGIPEEQWCYEPNADGEYSEGMKVKARHVHLHGYRLPTEWEWEFACRAGSKTAWYFGDVFELAPHYAWELSDELQIMRPGGLLKPNAFGLFDMLGNTKEICFDIYEPVTHPGDDEPEGMEFLVEDRRVQRGGAVYDDISLARSAYRQSFVPINRRLAGGMRIIRTLESGSTQ